MIIGAETSMHADLVEAAAGAGKSILLQKPMALTLEDCDRIVRGGLLGRALQPGLADAV